MSNWYDKYKELNYVHLGNDISTGIDCGNLITLIYKEQLGIIIPYSTSDFCKDTNENWYMKVVDYPFTRATSEKWGWRRKGDNEQLELYDVVCMTIGSANCINHCAIVVDIVGRYPKLLHIMLDRKSWTAPYGKIYKSQTEMVVTWIGM